MAKVPKNKQVRKSQDVAELRAENERLRRALEPLAKIATAYYANDLDQARPSWGRNIAVDKKEELFSGRGGKSLLILEDAFRARAALAPASSTSTLPRPTVGRAAQLRRLVDPTGENDKRLYASLVLANEVGNELDELWRELGLIDVGAGRKNT